MGAGTLLAATALLAGGCSSPYAETVPLPTTVVTSAPGSDASPVPSAQATTPPPDELAKGGVRHTIRTEGLTVRVDYAAPVPAQWTSDAGTSLRVTVTVRNDGSPKQKVYLSRATVRFVVSDGSSYLPSPDPLIETANLSPGYLVSNPYGYVQSFSVPGVDQSAQLLIIDLKLDLVSLVDAKARDFSKQSVTDSVSTVARS